MRTFVLTRKRDMQVKLSEIAYIQFGLHAQQTEEGYVAYYQARHFDDTGQLIGPVDSFIDVPAQDNGHLLRDGDVLLAGKGFRIFAHRYDAINGPAIASTLFFVIHPKEQRVLSDYLAIYLNLPTTRTYFEQLAAGSSIPSIRKGELAECPVLLPSLEQQQRVVQVHRLHLVDLRLSEALINAKKQRLQAVVQQLIRE